MAAPCFEQWAYGKNLLFETLVTDWFCTCQSESTFHTKKYLLMLKNMKNPVSVANLLKNKIITFYVNLILFDSLDMRRWIVWKLMNFSTTYNHFTWNQIWQFSRLQKWSFWQFSKFWFWSIFALVNCWNWHARSKIRAYLQTCQNTILGDSEIDKIDFTSNPSGRKMIKFSHCVLYDYLAIVGNTDSINEA